MCSLLFNKAYFYSDSGRGMRWRATPLTPNLAQFEHEEELADGTREKTSSDGSAPYLSPHGG